jgi:hypothetical protein
VLGCMCFGKSEINELLFMAGLNTHRTSELICKTFSVDALIPLTCPVILHNYNRGESVNFSSR